MWPLPAGEAFSRGGGPFFLRVSEGEAHFLSSRRLRVSDSGRSSSAASSALASRRSKEGIKKEEAAPAVEVVRDELEQYLEDADVPGCDEDILNTSSGGALVRRSGQRLPRWSSSILRRQHHRQEWSVSSRRLARCMVTSRRRPRTRRSSTRSLQHSTLTNPRSPDPQIPRFQIPLPRCA